MIANILNFMNIGTGELIIIVFIILLLFGGKKIPELMKGIGKGVRSFKKGMNEIEDEINKPVEDEKKDAEKK
ncbi:MAG: twin-arginine translocase TatA/TatE family subunit [Muribaculaceae bacterium]|nr:twin-arginine translocase TatA/TatE family subunit [Muribaculaceae bacterium]